MVLFKPGCAKPSNDDHYIVAKSFRGASAHDVQLLRSHAGQVPERSRHGAMIAWQSLPHPFVLSACEAITTQAMRQLRYLEATKAVWRQAVHDPDGAEEAALVTVQEQQIFCAEWIEEYMMLLRPPSHIFAAKVWAPAASEGLRHSARGRCAVLSLPLGDEDLLSDGGSRPASHRLAQCPVCFTQANTS